jgi:hypothetical protein
VPLPASFNEHIEEDGPIVFKHACKLGLEGIVSKRKARRIAQGARRTGVRMKNPKVPAVTREAKEDWGRPSSRR